MKTINTTITRYWFNIGKPEQAAAYAAMVEKNKLKSRHEHHVHAGTHRASAEGQAVSEPITLETTCIFENQWNATDERVFDWYEGIGPNKQVKQGHWLEFTPEMLEIRQKTLKCGYCGEHYGPHHKAVPENGFCSACLDSQYLVESNLHLLRLVSPAASTRKCGYEKARPALSKKEAAWLVPLYVTRQTTGNESRANAARIKQGADITAKRDKEIRDATKEHDGMMWLWEKGFDVSNWIYYSHTGRFCLGWPHPASKAVVSKVLDIIREFPFHYTIKEEGGRVLES